MALLTTFTAQTIQTNPVFLAGSGNPSIGAGMGYANCSFCSGNNGDCIASYEQMVQCATSGGGVCDNIFPCPTAPAPGSAGGTLNALTTNNPAYTIPGGLWNNFQTNRCGTFNNSQANQCSNIDSTLCPVPSGTPFQVNNFPPYSLTIPGNSSSQGQFLSPGAAAGTQVLNTYFINAPTYYDDNTTKPATVGCDYDVSWFKTMDDLQKFTKAFKGIDPNFNQNYAAIISNLCTQVYTPGPNAPADNQCPIDPLTGLPMPQCSYFLARDPGGIGIQCRTLISGASCTDNSVGPVNSAFNNFCENPATSGFPECLCINRTSNLVYQQASNKATSQQSDYCWWFPCKNAESTIYLTPTICTPLQCADICQTIVKNYDNNVGGNFNENINSYIQCDGAQPGGGGTPPPPPDHDLNWLLIVGLGIIFLIIVIIVLFVMSKAKAKKEATVVNV
jgi:hypothetical protein